MRLEIVKAENGYVLNWRRPVPAIATTKMTAPDYGTEVFPSLPALMKRIKELLRG